jgi:hypothetical protein
MEPSSTRRDGANSPKGPELSEGTNVQIDANRVIDKLARRIAELEVTIAQQEAVIAALMDDAKVVE